MSTTSLRVTEIKFISVISLCTLLWTLTPDAFAVSGKNKSVKTVTKTASKSAPKTAGRTSQAPTLNTLLNGLGAPNATDGIDGDFYLDTLSSNLYGPKRKGKWPLPKNLVGPVGPQGPVGKQGSEGKVGDKGATTSSAGSQGAQGIQGPQGTQGTPGPAGSSGPSGGAGIAGSVGATGAPGPQGSPGSAGAPGVGATGLQGVAGTPGSTGARGPIGETGTAGADGPQGTAGILTLIRGVVSSLSLSTSSAGTGIDSSAVVQFKQNKKYEFSIKLIGTIPASQTKKAFGMTVTASNSIDLNYVVTTLEANTFRNGNSEHEYVFESSGTFECPTVPGLLSYSVLDAQGITGANPMSITGTYLLREVSTIFTVNQGSPVSSW
jgi:hypothetical protein